MGDSIKKYFENVGHFGSNAKEIEKVMSDREIMDSKYPTNNTVDVFEKTYPELAVEFQKIQQEQYNLFASKMLDYGLGNISLGSTLEEQEDKDFSMMGIWLRCNDKVNRLKNLLKRNGNAYVKSEPLVDSFIDISNYGIIAQLVLKGKWK